MFATNNDIILTQHFHVCLHIYIPLIITEIHDIESFYDDSDSSSSSDVDQFYPDPDDFKVYDHPAIDTKSLFLNNDNNSKKMKGIPQFKLEHPHQY